ncbi:hypothetical protein C7N43_07660 [Sphingobacteriales bacterium UPWRP_1]|nr:hypothetical protein B6N25_08980 [Sphingobacteriales bacterium TSM_CSS]PSJ77636.1 hypothetical protein C7N43_07660 [Sphingobacteriales bacterium UPWRP_1]
MRQILTKYTSLIALLFIAVFYVLAFTFFKPWKTGQIKGGGDSWGYYAYLPATFIYHDLDSLHRTVAKRYEYEVNLNPDAGNPLGVGEAHQVENTGRQVFKYTMGVAILQLPFFALAHLLSSNMGYPPDGYSNPYLILVLGSGMFYVLFGLFILRKLLRQYFSEGITALALGAVALGTNLFYFSVYNSGMSHSYLFMLYSILLYVTISWHKKPRIATGLIIGLCCGFITVIRPVEVVCIVLPILYGIPQFFALPDKISFIWQHKIALFSAVAGAILAGLPQLLYWKIQTGEWLYYSYKDESFNFLRPHIIDGLTSFSNGWLSYTPIMIFGVAGLWLLYKQKNPFAVGILVFLPIHIYVAYSWWCWSYINGFGSRPMVETYPLIILPLGYCFISLTSDWFKRLLLFPVLFFLTVLNIFQTYQLSLGVMWSEVTNFTYYRSIFGKTKLEYRNLVMFDSNEWQPNDLVYDRTLYINTFEEDTARMFLSDSIVYEGKKSIEQSKKNEFIKVVDATLQELDVKGGEWLRISANCYSPEKVYSWYKMGMLVLELNGPPFIKKWCGVRIQSKLGNDECSLWGGKERVWDEVSMFVKVPKLAFPSVKIKAIAWNAHEHKIYLDNLKVEVWKKGSK